MSDPNQPTFLVSAYTDPVAVQINGKANYLNCNNFREFMNKMVGDGKTNFILDFENCKGMDSTFLGILAGTALEIRNQVSDGKLTVCRLSERNKELIVNLGLQALLDIQEVNSEQDASFDSLENATVTNTSDVLNAHENLVKCDEQNAAKFQDVIAFLKNQVDSENDA